MLTELAKQGLARILEISSPDDVKSLAQKCCPSIPQDTSHQEAIETILNYVQKPSEILRKNNVKKDIIIAYLEELGVPVPEELSKDGCIRMCLDKWHVKDDRFWEKLRRSKEKNSGDTYRLDNYMNREKEVSQDYQMDKTMEILESVQEENLFTQLEEQKEDEEEVQILSPMVTRRKSPSKASMERVHISSLPSLSSTERKPASLTTSHRGSESPSLLDELSPLLSDSFDCLPAVSKLEHQSISHSVPQRCSSAPNDQDNLRQSTFSSKSRHSFSAGQDLSPRILLREPISTEPSSFATDLRDTIGLSSAGNTEGEDGSVPVFPDSWSRRLCKTERESPEPPSAKLLSLSQQAMKTDDLPPVGTVEGYRRSLPVSRASSSFSYRGICRAERESPQVIRSSMSKPLVSGVSVSNATVQTLMSEFPEIPDNGSTGLQTNTGYMWSTEKELSPKNYKRGLIKHQSEECTISHHKNRNDLSSLPMRKDYTAGVSVAKRSRCTSSPDPEDFGSLSTLLECPHCEKQYFSSFPPSERSESDVSRKPQGQNRKRPLSVSKDTISPEQRRVTLPSKRAKGTSEASLASQRSSIKAKTIKRKYPTLSPSEEAVLHHGSRRQPTLSLKQLRCTSAVSSERHKKSKLSFRDVNNNTVVKSGSEDRDSSESSTDCPPPYNPTDKMTDAPSRSSSAPAEILSVSESKLKSKDTSDESENSDTSDENENSSTESPPSPALEKPLPRPRRYCCTLM